MTHSANGLLDSIEIVDTKVRQAAVKGARERGVRLPTFAQLAGHDAMPGSVLDRLRNVDPDVPDSDNLWRVNWYNEDDRRSFTATPRYVVVPKALTGVEAPIVALLGANFPMIGAHKVLPAYACLVTKLVSGRFNPDRHRAVWPSTGNYCRGGVAISRILGCAGIAVLPEGMSKERFQWLEKWVADPSHIIRTHGTESNVKEIYDKCHELAQAEENVILNQFSAFPNYLAHYLCTGTACDKVFKDLERSNKGARLAALVSATGSAGTIAAGDHLKAKHGTRIAAVEALECPTLLEGGYGEHNIQGIGDKHVPLIHNVLNMDYVIGVSDRSTDRLNLLFRGGDNRDWLMKNTKMTKEDVKCFDFLGISSLANIVAAIKLAKYMNYGPNDVVMTIATDGAQLYESEANSMRVKEFPQGLSNRDREEILLQCVHEPIGLTVVETNARDRRRMFNQGYYTWVEQQGTSIEDFDARRDQDFWKSAADTAFAWDEMITQFNGEVGLN